MTPLLTGVFASQISGHLNPWAPTSAYDALSTVIVPSGGLSEINFAGIPQTGYSHLQLRCHVQTNRATYGRSGLLIRFNNDTGSNYSYHYAVSFEENSTASAAGGGSQSAIDFDLTGTSTANSWGTFIIDIVDYSSANKNKTVRGLTGVSLNELYSGAGGGVGIHSGAWFNTTPINSIKFIPARGESTINQYSHFALYGVK